MKVLHLTGGGDIGGAKTHVLSLVHNLSKNIDVKMISFRSGPFADDGKAMGINVQVVNQWNIFSAIVKVVKTIKTEKYDIIHSHGAKANLVAIISKLFTGLPSVTTVHSDYKLDYMHSFIKRYSYGVLNTISLRFFDYYICVSESLRTFLIKRHFNINNIYTIPNGIDFENQLGPMSKHEFADRYHVKYDESTIKVGILARLTAVKGLNVFLKAAALVIKENPQVQFFIGGEGEDRKPLERLTEELNLSSHVFFLGHVNESYEFMNFIDINVLSSISEGFPYSILEGTRLKKATISSRVGGIPDLVNSGENGYLFPSGDHEKLAQLILTLSNNSEQRREMGERIFEKSKKLYSIRNMYTSQLTIYDKILHTPTVAYRNDVMVSGYYGYRNSGDDAILMAIIDSLRQQKPDIRILVLSKRPMETKLKYSVDTLSRLNVMKILLAMKKTKLYINGGGNLMQDSTSTRSILYYLTTTWLAMKMGCKVMVYANGIGPINRNYNRQLTSKILNKVDIITLRENLSQNVLAELQITRPQVIVTADPALTVEAADRSKIDEILQKEGLPSQGLFVGFSARTCENNVFFDDQVLAKVADEMISNYRIIPVFIPMQPKDLQVIDRIVASMKGKAFIIRGNYDVASVVGIIGRMEMMVGMRLHSLIYAASLGIPVVGLVYDAKVEAFLQYFRQTSAGNISELTYNKLMPLVETVWMNRKTIRQDLKQITTELKQKALENSKIAVDLLEREVK